MSKFWNGLLAAAMMLAPGLAMAQVPGMAFPPILYGVEPAVAHPCSAG